MFPKAVDHHKPDKPLVPNGLGVIYVLASVVYLFLLYFFDNEKALPLATCILFGGFMGLLDDWMDLRWRYKAFLPIFVAMPLTTLALELSLRTSIATYIFGNIDFGVYYYFLIIPLIVTVTTNTVNQLGGLNGLETICPLIIMAGLMLVSGGERILLYVPAAVCVILAYYNFRGKIFIGNAGSFAVGITLASYAILSDVKSLLLIAILPYVFNSSLILLNYFLFRQRARVSLDAGRLHADHPRSLVTLIAHYRPSTERQIVGIISLIVSTFTAVAVVVWGLKL